MGNSRENIFFGDDLHRNLQDPVQEYWRNFSEVDILDMYDGVKIIRIPKNVGAIKISHFKAYMRDNGYKILGTRESSDQIFISYRKASQ